MGRMKAGTIIISLLSNHFKETSTLKVELNYDKSKTENAANQTIYTSRF